MHSAGKVILSLALLFLVQDCSIVGDDSPPFHPSHGDRRMYLHDSASNDSLNAAVFSGFTFYAQPGASYTLLTKGIDASGARLHLYRLFEGWVSEYPAPVMGIPNPLDTAEMLFSFGSAGFESEHVWGVVRDANGEEIRELAEETKMMGTGAYDSIAFKVNLYSMGTYTYYTPTQAGNLIKGLQSSLDTLFRLYGNIRVEANGPFYIGPNSPVSLNIMTDLTDPIQLIGGDTAALNIIFVDRIFSDTLGQTILGVSPREGWEMNSSFRNLIYMSMESSGTPLVYTLAHEMGHFFGLRHTVSTSWDLSNDNDLSNIEDGLTDTKTCDISDPGTTIGKIGAVRGWNIRILASREIFSACSTDDWANLMFPYAGTGFIQDRLSTSQASLMKKNIALLPH